jgi:acetoacetyl-CoA synthetase
MTDILWSPSDERVRNSEMTRFSEFIAQSQNQSIPSYQALHQWSVAHPDLFWQGMWDFADVLASRNADQTVVDIEKMPGARWFPGARLNYAENLLRTRPGAADTMMVFSSEGETPTRLARQTGLTQVANLAAWFRQQGLQPGDRVAAYLPNLPQTVIAMLAATSCGAVWSSCSPDFGVQGVLDRFGQIDPKIFICCDAYRYGGKIHDCLEKTASVLADLPTVEQVLVIPYAGRGNLGQLPDAHDFAAITAGEPKHDLVFEQLPFDHPLFIMYSSGTTGAPKCIVHGAGGTLLQHLKEHMLHTNVVPGDRLFYFTTTGWMMWNWLVSGLASGATLMLYDGSPFHPDGNVLFDYAQKERITIFGTSAKYIDSCHKAGIEPKRTHDLSALKTICSTGSPLSPESFDYVYKDVKADVCLSSISGGTDIISCFALGNPNLPVRRGELQCLGLGLDVAALDDNGTRLAPGEKGELSCMTSFPCMPIGFWRDEDGSRYHAAYFSRFDNVWCHGDYVAITEYGGLIIYGRSDAVLTQVVCVSARLRYTVKRKALMKCWKVSSSDNAIKMTLG